MSRLFKKIITLEESEELVSRNLSLTILNAEAETTEELLERSYERPEGAKSSFYNSEAIHTFNFYKPISKPVNLNLL